MYYMSHRMLRRTLFNTVHLRKPQNPGGENTYPPGARGLESNGIPVPVSIPGHREGQYNLDSLSC